MDDKDPILETDVDQVPVPKSTNPIPRPIGQAPQRMPKPYNSDMRKVFKRLKKAGLSVERGGKHHRVMDADGNVLCGIPCTPGNSRWIADLKTDLKRAGHDIEL